MCEKNARAAASKRARVVKLSFMANFSPSEKFDEVGWFCETNVSLWLWLSQNLTRLLWGVSINWIHSRHNEYAQGVSNLFFRKLYFKEQD